MNNSGELLNPYTKIKLTNYTTEVLNKFCGILIEEFTLDKIEFVKSNPSEVNINIYMSIKPYGSIEFISMKVEV